QPPACSWARHRIGITAEACRPTGYFSISRFAQARFSGVKAKLAGCWSGGARRRTDITTGLAYNAAMPGSEALRRPDVAALHYSFAGLRLLIKRRPDQPGHRNLNAGRIQDNVAISPDIGEQPAVLISHVMQDRTPLRYDDEVMVNARHREVFDEL